MRFGESKWGSFIERLPDGFVYGELLRNEAGQATDCTILAVNPAFAQIWGLRAEDMVAKGMLELLLQSQEPGMDWLDTIQNVAQTGSDIELESVFFRGRWYDITVSSHEKDFLIAYFRDRTKNKQAEEALKESEMKYRTLVLSVPGVIFQCTNDAFMTLEFISDGIEGIVGIPATEFLVSGRPYSSIVYPEDQAKLCSTIKQAIEKKEPYVIQYRVVHRDGSLRWVNESGQGAFDEEGDLVFLYGVITDSTCGKAAEEALSRNEAKYRQLTERMSDVVWTTDLELRDTYVSPSIESLVGYTPLEYMEIPVQERFTPASVGQIQEVLKEEFQRELDPHAKPDRSRQLELQQYRRDRSTVWVSMNVSFLRDEKKRVVGILGVTRDVSAQKELESVLLEERKKLEDLMVATNVGTWEWNVQTGETVYDERWAAIMGYTLEELHPLTIDTWKRLSHSEDLKLSDQQFEEVFSRKREFYDMECRVRHKDGRWIWVHDQGDVTEWTKDGKPLIARGTHTDISKRKEAAEQIRHSQEMLRLVMNSIPHLIYWKDRNSVYLGCNKAGAIAMDLTDPLDIVGLTDFDLFPDSPIPARVQAMDEDVMGQRQARYHVIEQAKLKDTDEGWIDHSRIPLFDGEGNVSGVLVMIEDITERMQMQEELRRSEERFKSIIAVSNTGAWEYHKEQDYLWCSPEYFHMLGLSPLAYSLEEKGNLERLFLQLVHPEDQKRALSMFTRDLNASDSYRIKENFFRMRHTRGHWVWIWARGQVLFEKDEPTGVMIGTHIDITPIKEIEQALYLEKELFKTTLLSVGDGVISTDHEGRIQVQNGVAEKLTGYTQEEAKGKPLSCVFRILDEFSRLPREDLAEIVLTTGKIVEVAENTVLVAKDGTERPIEDSAAPIYDEEGRMSGVVVVFRDFTEKRRKQEQIQTLSYRDQLTGLHNRRYLAEELERCDGAENLPITVLLLDVNGLKLTNDAFGHASGDALLQLVGKGLEKLAQEGDILARMGGDEFVLCMLKTGEEEAKSRVQDIEDFFSRQRIRSIPVSVSCGFATKNRVEESIQEITKIADDNMYRRKIRMQMKERRELIQTILRTLWLNIPREEQHSQRVGWLCGLFGSALGMDQTQVDEITQAGIFHDIGKVAINPRVLEREEPLSEVEWRELRRHPEVGYSILSSANDYSALAGVVVAHHENWDGTGYPSGLQGEQIPWQARVIAIAEAYDHMVSGTPYRVPLKNQEALAEIASLSGTQFDPMMVKVFVELMQGEKK